MSKDQSYRPKYPIGCIVRSRRGLFNHEAIIDRTEGENEVNAICHLRIGKAMIPHMESSIYRISLRNFFWWRDPITGKYRIGLMGWAEGIFQVLASLIVAAMCFTPIDGWWKIAPLVIGFGRLAMIIVGTVNNYRRLQFRRA